MNQFPHPRISDVSKSLEHAALLNRTLHIVLQDQPLRHVLEQALEELLALSWLGILPKGGIFLVDETGKQLELFAERNLGPQITTLCANVKFGHCLCGLAALDACSQHASCIDDWHETRFGGIAPHGHYNVPIMMNRELLGVLVIYLTDGHERDEDVVQFLESYADLLALAINAKQREHSVLNTQNRLRDALADTDKLMGTIKSHTIFSQTAMDGTITDVNELFCQISGFDRDALIGARHDIVNSQSHSAAFWRDFWKTISSGKAWRGEICNRRKTGELYWVDSTVMPFVDADGKIERYVSIRFDITERKQAEEALARMGRILDESSNEIYVFDAETLLFTQLNRGARENLGYSVDEIASLTPIDVKPEHTVESFVEMLQPLLRRDIPRMSFETNHKRKDGTHYPVLIDLQYAGDEHPPIFVAIVQDITERKANDKRIERLAFYDSLTGLANRALMTDRLKQAVSRAERSGHNVRLLYLDLDRFKEINDTRGHSIGDQTLTEIAGRFRSVIREAETLARIGGDEFVIILEDVSRDKTINVIERLKEKLAHPVDVDGKSHSLGVSIGVATYPESGDSPDTLLQMANIAMYDAKANGGGYRFYDHDMGLQLARRLQIADRLISALAGNRLQLHYQPIVDLATGRARGAEALLRWYEPGWGWIAPDEFIPIAADRRLLPEIGSWVIDEACRQYAEWQHQGFACPDRLAVNVAAQQMEGSALLDSFHAAIARHGVSPRVLEAEITESSMMQDPDRAAEILTELKDLGVGLSIDDFGTGYSSLAYLKQFNTDKLKIDMSFVRDLMNDQNCQAIVSATIGMARGLGLRVLAEGVETKEQEDHLRRLRCDEVQGFLYGKAMHPDIYARTILSAT
jgi:diguanylate cyclase (GGDEF)-like protein/PAS domain S-box-containing protein